MRELGLAIALWTLLLVPTSGVRAQAAIAAASVNQDRLPPSARITLRPAPGLEVLAARIARVLALRSDTTVEIGPPPPPILEAVPTGNVALARDEDTAIHLVLGAALGESLEAHVALSPDGKLNLEEDARALALAIEALRDQAIEGRALDEPVTPPPSLPTDAPAPDVSVPEEVAVVDTAYEWPVVTESGAPQPSAAPSVPPAQPAQPVNAPAQVPSQVARHEGVLRDDGTEYPRPENKPDHNVRVEPMLYLGLYGGASNESNTLRTGITTGGGLCVIGQCVLLAVEYPLPINMNTGGDDVRYRYPTFSLSFYSRPFKFGNFTPAASIGLLSRIGHFERDMGLDESEPGLDTDLAVRGTLEGAYEIFDSVDILAEGGLDYALDRWQFGNGASPTFRGSRLAPWLQAGIRIRPR